MASAQRSLRASARSWRMWRPVGTFQREPARFIRIWNRVLQVASTLPLPIGRPAARAAA